MPTAAEEYIARINAANPGGENPHVPFVQGGTTGGYLAGIGETVAPGRSLTRAEHDRYYNEALAAGIPQEWLDDYLARNPWDAHRAIEGYRSETTGSGRDQQTGTTGSLGAAGGNWFSMHAPGGGGNAPTFGATPEAYAETFTALERPAHLRDPYVAPTWNETFKPPTMEELTSDQGYQSRLATGLQGRQRAAAAQGSILSGGTQKALERFAQDYASNEYAQAHGRAFDTYRQRYGQFMDSANLGLGARQVNESQFATDSASHLNQYNTRYKAYQDAITNRRNAERDAWDREYGMARLGLDATLGGRP